jgi:hypothetical protein
MRPFAGLRFPADALTRSPSWQVPTLYQSAVFAVRQSRLPRACKIALQANCCMGMGKNKPQSGATPTGVVLGCGRRGTTATNQGCLKTVNRELTRPATFAGISANLCVISGAARAGHRLPLRSVARRLMLMRMQDKAERRTRPGQVCNAATAPQSRKCNCARSSYAPDVLQSVGAAKMSQTRSIVSDAVVVRSRAR